MVNASDLFVSIVAGLAMPLAMLDGFKALAGSVLPSQSAGFQFERRPLVWLLAVLLGPGLFADRMISSWRGGELSAVDRINAVVITLGWSAVYGFAALSLIETIIPA